MMMMMIQQQHMKSKTTWWQESYTHWNVLHCALSYLHTLKCVALCSVIFSACRSTAAILLAHFSQPFHSELWQSSVLLQYVNAALQIQREDRRYMWQLGAWLCRHTVEKYARREGIWGEWRFCTWWRWAISFAPPASRPPENDSKHRISVFAACIVLFHLSYFVRFRWWLFFYSRNM